MDGAWRHASRENIQLHVLVVNHVFHAVSYNSVWSASVWAGNLNVWEREAFLPHPLDETFDVFIQELE